MTTLVPLVRPVTTEIFPSSPSSLTRCSFAAPPESTIIDAVVGVVEKRGCRDPDAAHRGQRDGAGDGHSGFQPEARVRKDSLHGKVGRAGLDLSQHGVDSPTIDCAVDAGNADRNRRSALNTKDVFRRRIELGVDRIELLDRKDRLRAGVLAWIQVTIDDDAVNRRYDQRLIDRGLNLSSLCVGRLRGRGGRCNVCDLQTFLIRAVDASVELRRFETGPRG